MMLLKKRYALVGLMDSYDYRRPTYVIFKVQDHTYDTNDDQCITERTKIMMKPFQLSVFLMDFDNRNTKDKRPLLWTIPEPLQKKATKRRKLPIPPRIHES